MRLFRLSVPLWAFAMAAIAIETELVRVSERQQKFAHELANEFQELKKANAKVAIKPDGWLFFAPEFRLLSTCKFWAEHAREVAPTRKPDEADPAAAIIDFCNQLKQRGIGLLLVPVPPKAAIYPDKALPDFDLHGENAAPYLTRFYDELRGNGVDIVDLAPLFVRERESDRGPVFCKTDTHWSGNGCVLAAQEIAARIKMASQPRREYVPTWKQVEFTGDLVTLLPPDAPKPAHEKAFVRVISDKSDGAPVLPNPDSPVLLLGDSHTLVYHDFLTKGAGLVDELAYELGFAPDLIGTRGSGATAVRIDLYRRSRKDPGYLAKKKMIVWCFSAREFTEADAWARIPVSK